MSGHAQVYADVEARIQRARRVRALFNPEPVEVRSWQSADVRLVGDPLARWKLAVSEAERVWAGL